MFAPILATVLGLLASFTAHSETATPPKGPLPSLAAMPKAAPIKPRTWQAEAEPVDRDFGIAKTTAPEKELPASKEVPEQKQATTQEPEEEIEGIDTADLPDPQGNWLFKRIWWERAESRYEQVRADAERMAESRVSFFTQRSDVERNVLDPFYMNVGFKRGELTTFLNDMVNRLEEDREGELTEKERVTLALLKEEERQLKKLAEDVERVNAIDGQIDGTLSKLTEAINRVRRHEHNAWESFREIAHTLSDERARELFFKIDEAWRNIDNIRRYIEEQLTPHFTRIITNAKSSTTEISSTIDALRKRGIKIAKEVDVTATLPATPKTTADEDDEKEEEVIPQQGILESYILSPLQTVVSVIMAPFQFAWDGVVWLIQTPYRLIFGEPAARTALDDEEEE